MQPEPTRRQFVIGLACCAAAPPAEAGAKHGYATTAADWCEVRAEYYPPSGLVWTTEGEVVRKAEWQWEPLQPLESGQWLGEAGKEVAVTHWHYAGAELRAMPAPPERLPSKKRQLAKVGAVSGA